MANQVDTRWRAVGPYLPTSVIKQALLDETRLFLLALARTGDPMAARDSLVSGELPHRSVCSRTTIAKIIKMRLTSWNPPRWVLDDLIAFAKDEHSPALQAALLLHVPRQDALLYDLVQTVIVPRWASGERAISRGDVHRFLDEAETEHPEIDGWSNKTRQMVASNSLTILRDYGLLRGAVSQREKHVVEPVVPTAVANHLVRCLRAEGIADGDLASHPDWRIWLWDTERARQAIAASENVVGEGVHERRGA